jgi:hypothetical protein
VAGCCERGNESSGSIKRSLLASQGGLSSMELVGWLVGWLVSYLVS